MVDTDDLDREIRLLWQLVQKLVDRVDELEKRQDEKEAGDDTT